MVLYRPSDHASARLGLAISKKCARRAVERNRLKRIVRESFRCHCPTLPQVDVVVLCAHGVTAQTNQRLFKLLERAWAAIRKQHACVEC